MSQGCRAQAIALPTEPQCQLDRDPGPEPFVLELEQSPAKIMENGLKMIENGLKMLENGLKMIENGPKMIENGNGQPYFTLPPVQYSSTSR
jgi:hypothetical protein